MMQIVLDFAQDVGSRATQQDSCGYCVDAHGGRGAIAVLSDGVGGAANGEYYSQLAVDELLAYFRESEPEDDLCDILASAFEETRQRAMQDRKDEGSATVVAVLVRDGQCAFISVGDSHICLFRKGGMIPLNRPQTLGDRFDISAALGYLTWKDAQENRMRKALSNHLCDEFDSPCDICPRAFALMPGDRLALMSDGVCNALSEEELCACAEKEGAQGAAAMIDLIRSKHLPGQDNCSVLMVACK